MTLIPPPVFRDANGHYFWRCAKCGSYEGAFRTEVLATVSLYNHKLRRHTT